MTTAIDIVRTRVRAIGIGLPRTYWVLWFGMLVNRAGCFVLPFLAVYLTQGRGFAPATAGAIAALYGAGAAVASALGGYLADHVGRRATMAGALLLGGLGMIALGFARELWLIAPATFLVALLGECYRPAMQAAVADLVPPNDRVRAFGILYWVINLGFSIGLVLGGVLASRSFLWLFVGDGLTSIAFAVIVLRAVPETRPAHAPPAAGGEADAPHAPPRRSSFVAGFLAPYRDRPFAVFVGLSVLALLVFMQHVAALPIEMGNRGVSRAWLGFVLGLNGMVIVLVQPFLAPVLGRFNRSRVLTAGACLLGLGFGLNVVATGVPMYGLGVVVWTVGEICLLPTSNAVVADIALPHMRGRYQGAYGLSFGLAGFGAPLIGTSVLQRFGSTALWLGCLVAGLIVAVGHAALAPHLTRLREERIAARGPA
jgi:MFS family permease